MGSQAWNWTKEYGLAVLRYSYRSDVQQYNDENIRLALATVRTNRAHYATEEAWQERVNMFEDGVACIEETS